MFYLAQWQADADAWTDAVNETSTLPAVTFVTPEKNAALGRKLDDDGNGYVYLFPALPSKRDRTLRPPVLVIYESANGDQMIILTPQPLQ